ncbi:MAG TPA: hypothetical protein VGZ71_12910 [Puia sp.]|jgi:hypothetical protein|nr:hypothetical protein [Puia sp.]
MDSNVANPVQQCPKKADNKPPQDPKKKWIKFLVQDDKGVPLANVRLNVILPDNSTEEVCTDEKGMVEINNVEEGNCKIESDWRSLTVDQTVHLHS